MEELSIGENSNCKHKTVQHRQDLVSGEPWTVEGSLYKDTQCSQLPSVFGKPTQCNEPKQKENLNCDRNQTETYRHLPF